MLVKDRNTVAPHTRATDMNTSKILSTSTNMIISFIFANLQGIKARKNKVRFITSLLSEASAVFSVLTVTHTKYCCDNEI